MTCGPHISSTYILKGAINAFNKIIVLKNFKNYSSIICFIFQDYHRILLFNYTDLLMEEGKNGGYRSWIGWDNGGVIDLQLHF